MQGVGLLLFVWFMTFLMCHFSDYEVFEAFAIIALTILIGRSRIIDK